MPLPLSPPLVTRPYAVPDVLGASENSATSSQTEASTLPLNLAGDLAKCDSLEAAKDGISSQQQQQQPPAPHISPIIPLKSICGDNSMSWLIAYIKPNIYIISLCVMYFIFL